MFWILIAIVYFGICYIWHDTVVRPYFEATKGIYPDKREQKMAVDRIIPWWKKNISRVLYFPLNVAMIFLAVLIILVVICLIAVALLTAAITSGINWIIEYKEERKFKKSLKEIEMALEEIGRPK